MSSAVLPPAHRAFATLQGLARKRASVERCELCAVSLAEDHQHLIDPAVRKLLCACDACAVLFAMQSGTKYKRVPRRVRVLTEFRLTDSQWDALMLPINMAFFFRSTPDQRVLALYPSPAGPTESMLGLSAWNDIVQENPILASMEPDVEAFLVNRLGQSRGFSGPEYFLTPIDECYRLVGLIRANWRGLSGGSELWREIGQFFAGLREKTISPPGGGRA
jgi:hypothetical protein